MGVRFACHVCNKQLNIKRELAGRRGVCPQCQSRIRIPMEDTAQSSPVDDVRIIQSNAANSAGRAASQEAAGSTGNGGGAAVMAESQRVSKTAVSTPAAPATRVSNGAPVVTDHHVTDRHAGQTLDVQNPSGQAGNVQQVAAGSILDEEPDATWYVRPPSGGQYGPASTVELQEWITQGRVAASALLWRDGWPQWRDASDALPEMSASLPGVTGAGGPEMTSTVTPGIQLKAGGKETAGAHSAVPLSGSTGIGAEQRSRTMRRISMISILVAIAATLIGVLFYVVNR
jgi:DNA-directed RNA polymerase subunit RPC12/RpoP